MHKHVSAIILALSLLAGPPVHAVGQEDSRYYAGLATGQSKSTLENARGERFSSKNHPLPVKLYGGLRLTDNLALEAGVSGAAGKYTFDRGLYGTVSEPQLATRALYLAMKGSVALSDSLRLHAKLGAAHSRFEMTNAGQHDRTLSGTKPMAGVGASYQLTGKLAATLEFEHYGTVRKEGYQLSQRKLQAGLVFGF